MLVTTTNDLPGFQITKTIGVVRGITVRSRSVFGNIGGAFQSLLGGRVSVYTDLAEAARQEAYELMISHATDVGANAIVGMRYDGNEIMAGITEVLAYGTAVKIVPL